MPVMHLEVLEFPLFLAGDDDACFRSCHNDITGHYRSRASFTYPAPSVHVPVSADHIAQTMIALHLFRFLLLVSGTCCRINRK